MNEEVCQIHTHFFQGSPKGSNPVDMLDQHNLEQHHRINTWPTVVLAVQIFYKFVYFLKSIAASIFRSKYSDGTMFSKLTNSSCPRFSAFFTSIFIPPHHYIAFSSQIREKRPPPGDLFQ